MSAKTTQEFPRLLWEPGSTRKCLPKDKSCMKSSFSLSPAVATTMERWWACFPGP